MSRETTYTRYVFYDGHEELSNEKGRIIAIKDQEQGVNNYVSLRKGICSLRAKYIQGSIEDYFSTKISDEPSELEYLLTGSWFLGWFQHISQSKIKIIEKDFQYGDKTCVNNS